jgi:hypothetical protein
MWCYPCDGGLKALNIHRLCCCISGVIGLRGNQYGKLAVDTGGYIF